jgi:asparagine synthase (glutamine-hydrolysing)
MCGIAGILLTPAMRHPARLAAVDAMTETLRHRGPDAGATWTDHEAGIALGHRRLAIVDLSEAGRQPMRSHGGKLVVSYNGEIYNFLELRAELEAAGRVFAGGSDTEVMLAAFEKYGVASALEKFAGMFAIALWDRERRSLHLIRDRLGKKPLYVTLVDGALLFASELRAFRAFPGFEPRIDSHAVACLLRFGWIPDELCIWQGVFRLPPASRIEITPAQIEAGGIEYLRESALRWWSPADAATTSPRSGPPSDTDTVLDELEGILRTAVRQRMVADVPLGAFLSGGIDSTTVVAMMQACSARPVRTFTVAFHERGYNEADHAGRIAGLRQFCAAVGVEFTPAMLSWAPGLRPTDGIWARHWYTEVETSTGFRPARPQNDPIPERLRAVYEACLGPYRRLYQHRIQPQAGETDA